MGSKYQKECFIWRMLFIVLFLFSVSAFASTEFLHPNASGDEEDWSPTGCSGPNHYQCVDDLSQDGDTTYLSSSTDGHTFLHNIEDLGPTTDVVQVTVEIWAKKIGSGNPPGLNARIKSGTTTENQFVGFVSSSASYQYLSYSWTTDPNTGSAWSNSAVDSLQIGVQRGPGVDLRISMVRAKVDQGPPQLRKLGFYDQIADNKPTFITGHAWGLTPTASSTNPAKVSFWTNSSCSTGEVIQCDYDTDTGPGACTSWSDNKVEFTSDTGSIVDGSAYVSLTTESGEASVCKLITIDNTAPTISGISTNDQGNHHGTMYNFSDPPTGTSGWQTDCTFVDCLEFDGSDDYIQIPHRTDTSFTGGDQFSIMIELNNADSSPMSGDHREIVVKGDSGNNRNFGLDVLDGTDEVRFYYNADGTAGGWHIWTSSNFNMPSGTDVNLAVTITFGTGSSVVMYKDGSTVSGSWTTGDGNTGPGTFNVPLYIGGIGTSFNWQGEISEVRIFKGRILTQTEIQNLDDTRIIGNESGIVAYHPLNRGKGRFVYDHKKTTVEGATVYKHDPVYIDFEPKAGPNANLFESCFRVRTLDSITLTDATGPDDVTGFTSFSVVGDGRIRIEPEVETGFTTADGPLEVNVSTGLEDCAGNPVTASFASGSDFTVSATIPSAERNIVVDSTWTFQNGILGVEDNRVFHDGNYYHIFVCDGSNIIHYSSTNRTDWVKDPVTYGSCSNANNFAVTPNPSFGEMFTICEQVNCVSYVRDINSPYTLTNAGSQWNIDTSCGADTGTEVDLAANYNAGKLHFVWRVGNTIYHCESQVSTYTDFSGTRDTLSVTSPGAMSLEDVALDQWLLYIRSGDLYARRWTGSAWTAEGTAVYSGVFSYSASGTWLYMNVVVRDSTAGTLHSIRLDSSDDTWESSVSLGFTSLRHCTSAIWQGRNDYILFEAPTTGISYNVYDGDAESWGTRTSLATASGSITYSYSCPNFENKTPFWVYLYNGGGGSWPLTIVFHQFDMVSTHSPGSSGDMITKNGERDTHKAMSPTYFKYVQTFGDTTCTNFSTHGQNFRLRCYKTETMALIGDSLVSDSDNHLDWHGNTSIVVDKEGYLYAVYGGRDVITVHDDPLLIRRTVLPINDPNFRPYMQTPSENTGLSPSPTGRGYKFMAVTDDGTTHLMLPGDSTAVMYLANNFTGSWAYQTVIDASCITAFTESMIGLDLAVAPNGTIGSMWVVQDRTTSTHTATKIYYTGFAFSGGTYTGLDGGGNAVTLPVQPDETGCSGSADQIYGGTVDGGGTNGNLIYDDNSNPMVVFHSDPSTIVNPKNIWFAKYSAGESASGDCQANWKCSDTGFDSIHGQTRIVYSLDLDLVFSDTDFGIKRVISSDLGETWGSPEEIVIGSDFPLLQHVEKGGTEKDFIFVYNLSYLQDYGEYYIKAVTLANLPVIYFGVD